MKKYLFFLLFGFILMYSDTIRGEGFNEAVLPSEQTVGNFAKLPSEATVPELRQAPDEDGSAQKEVASPLLLHPLLMVLLGGGFFLWYGKRVINTQKDGVYENI